MEDRERDNAADGDYEFMTETIKRPPVNKRKLFKKIFLTIFLGLLFGVCACLAFLFCYPWIQAYLYPPAETKPVSLPVAESVQDEEPVEPFVIPEHDNTADAAEPADTVNAEGDTKTTDTRPGEDVSEASEPDAATDKDEAGSKEVPEEKPEEKGDDTKPEEDSKEDIKPEDDKSDDKEPEDKDSDNSGGEGEDNSGQEADDGSKTGEDTSNEDTENGEGLGEPKEDEDKVVVNNVVETIEKQLELDDYRSLLRKISAIAETTRKSLVTVSGVSSNTDWFNNSYENNNSTTGMIVADNGKELLIVSPADILHNARNVRVTFCDGEMYSARVKESDVNVNLCIVAIDLERISEKTAGQIEMAQFGSLATSAVGIPVVAVGAPYGASGSVGMGQITSNSVVIDKTDSNVTIISTDIYASTAASGVLVNYNGRIVGIICHEDMSGNMPNLLRAYSVSDISDTIEKISNGQALATMGIIGTDVTEEANSDRGVPFGAYVKEVVADSPAMKAGIRNGDVIVKMGTIDIGSFTDYKQAILKYQPGEIITVTLQRPGRDEYMEMAYEITLEDQK